MASLISGYEYDIFISYRHNDNRSGWVTEFVAALQEELAATLKEHVSVYFDTNPHDGLLETHNVDKSLEGKLKCLIFIPIISQTYCDSKSFAWQHEFVAFNKLAKEDQFGRDIRLTSGNVASRILPIKINDLDPEDKTLLEEELGGALRSIEFIYMATGVNRPLNPSDNPDKNLNKTYYRDQINKVANAVKEIITAIKKHSQQDGRVINEVVKTESTLRRSLKPKILIGSLLVLALIVVGYFFIPKVSKSSEKVDKSIAVLPFKLLSDEPDKQYLADGTMDAILLHLQKFKDLRVLSRTSVEQYRGTNKTTHLIGKELGVAYLLEGSFQKSGDDVRLIVQLIKASDEESHAWANEYDRNWKDIFSVQSEVAQTIAGELHSVITPEEKQLISKIPTTNFNAYDLFLQARNEHMKFWMGYNTTTDGLNKAMILYHRTLQQDSSYAQAYSGLALGFCDKYGFQANLKTNFEDSMIIYANKALFYNDRLDEAFLVRGNYYNITGDYDRALKEYDESIKINPNYSWAYNNRAGLRFLKTFDIFGAFDDSFMAIQLEHGPLRPGMMRGLGYTLVNFGFPENARYYYEEAFKLDNDSISNLNSLAHIEEYQNDSGSLELSDKVLKEDPSNLDALLNRLYCYERLGKYEDEYHTALNIIQIWKEMGYSPQYEWDHIGFAFWKTGHLKEAKYYFDKQIDLGKKILNLDPNDDQGKLVLARVYAVLGEKEKALQLLNVINELINVRFKKGNISSVAFLYFLKYDPLLDNLHNESMFKNMVSGYENIYHTTYVRLKAWLEEKGIPKQ